MVQFVQFVQFLHCHNGHEAHCNERQPRPSLGQQSTDLYSEYSLLYHLVVLLASLPPCLISCSIAPRSFPFGMIGILFAPFIHSSFAHLGANSIPFFVTAAVINGTRGTAHFLLLSVAICVMSGLMVWAFGRSSTVHVGVSGAIFGYVGFLCIAAAIERNVTNVAIAILVLFMYGSMLFGIFPTDEQVSWEGHLFGFLMGGLISYIYTMNTNAREQIDRVADDITIGGSTDGERQPILRKSSGGGSGRGLEEDEV